MKDIKKTILTLVALLAVTTGAWADETPLVTINSTGYTTFTSGSKTFDDKVTVTFSNSVSNDGDHWGWYADDTASLLTVAGINGYTITSCKFYTFDGTAKTGYTVAGESPSVYLNNDYVYTDDSKSENLGKFGISKIEVYGGVASADADPNAVTAAEINSDLYSGWSSIDEKLLKASDLPGFQAVTENQAKSWTGVPSTGRVKLFYDFVADGNVKVVIFNNGVYDSSYEEEELTCYLIYEDIKYTGDTKYFYTTGPAPAASSGPEVAWNKDKKSGTFKMPGGNVTLEPEYYPQATVADGGVTAADADARATTDDPLVKVDATKLTGAKKLMYFVSNSGTTAPAYDAKGWTDQLPTAEGFTQQGNVYVWYYPVGTDEGVDGATATYSDGDILADNHLAVTIAAAPTYAVTFADDLAEPDKWSADPNTGVTKGQTVTVSYSGSKKVIGVKAEKKAKATGPTTVTLTPGEIGDLSSWGSTSKTINGITIAVSGDSFFNTAGLMQVSGYDPETGDPVPTTGTFTFTSSVGNIKRIDINHNSGRWWGSGAGWPGSYAVYDTSTFTWSGTPAASVTLSGSFSDEHDCSLYEVSSFVFTIEPTN